ncbi:hypothetical protein O181_005008 [Austropuccinia psidii MF-1]|uniref:Retrotransposon gag domain-containing protein n=1 Tax=Austropuccinia psidii MF-1 TaxID=1389203 RepID=A0A9Q3GF46_9BASI|nr:hypothetical protein [Austropuccinia psidii MF-1]
MPIPHSPPSRQTKYQARAQAVLTPTPRAPLESTPEVPQLRAQFGRSRTIQEESNGTEGVPAPVGASQGTGGPTLSQYNQPVSHQDEPSLMAIMQQMTKIMANLQAASSSEALRPPAFKTPSMKAPECFDGLNPSRNAKWIEHYLSNLNNQDPGYLHNSWNLLESQLFALLVDPNEVRKAEEELDALRMKGGRNDSLYIADFRSLVSRIGDWGERALIHHFWKGLPSRIWDQLASLPSRIYSLQDLMDITLELDTRYHERQKEKSNHQEKKPESSKFFQVK